MTSDSERAITIIRYEVTLEDLVAFNEYHMLHSPSALRKRHKMAPLLSLLVALLYGALGSMIHTLIPSIFGWWFGPVLGLSVGGLIYWRMRFARPRLANWMRSRIRKAYSAGENKTTLGEHSVEVGESGIINTTAFSVTQVAWGALERIETFADHTYLYIGAAQALIIPHDRILEGDFSAFLKSIRAHYTPDQRLPTSSNALSSASKV